MSRSLAVVKVGGSLFDWADLGSRLRYWLASEIPNDVDILLVPGGGAAADVVRRLDRFHGLGEEASHWLALRGLSLNAHFLASLLPSACVVNDWHDSRNTRRKEKIPILDVYKFARYDESRPGRLPHRWAIGSDALAARVAVVSAARHLVLLKSVTIPNPADWTEAGRLGWVDETFAEVLRQAPGRLQVRAVNLRAVGPRP